MSDGFLRQRFVGLSSRKIRLNQRRASPKSPRNPAGKREIMRDQTNIMLVRLFFGEFEREPKLLFGLRPGALRDQTKPARVGAFQKSFGVFVNEFFGFFEKFKARRAFAFAPRKTRQRMQRFGFAVLVIFVVQAV